MPPLGQLLDDSPLIQSLPPYAMKERSFANANTAEMLEDAPSNFDAEKSLAAAFMNLSFQDRTAIEEERHGVRCGATEETPKLLDESLRAFDQQLNARKESSSSSEDSSQSHDRIQRLLRNVVRTTTTPNNGNVIPTSNSNHCYLNDPKVRLRFLRSECFDVPKAVQRLVDFVDYSAELFGEYVADRPIRLSDFATRDEESALKNSRNQYLPYRDRSGRRVIVGVGACGFDLPLPLRWKILLFLHWKASEDIETQRKGIVQVAWPFDEESGDGDDDGTGIWEKSIRPSLRKEVSLLQGRLMKAMPVRIAGMTHLMKDTPFFRALLRLYVFNLSDELRPLFKAHFGESTELRYALGSLGIPTDLLPVSCTGTVKCGNVQAWFSALRTREDNIRKGKKDNDDIVDCPRSHDVVFRKGTTFRNNPGNSYYRGLIESHIEEHSKANKNAKFELTVRIVERIESRDGRFLEWSKPKQMWILIKDRTRVRQKIAAAFKQYARMKKSSPTPPPLTLPPPSSPRTVTRPNSPKGQLGSAIDHATDILDTSNNSRTSSNSGSSSKNNDDDNINKRSSPINLLGRDVDVNEMSLKDYYSFEHVRKRQKILDINGKNIELDDSGSCFGRCFFPTVEQ